MSRQFSISLKEKNKKKLRVIAEENHRTLNGQIEFIIAQFIEKYEDVRGKININNEEAD
jgi:hypothetical protein